MEKISFLLCNHSFQTVFRHSFLQLFTGRLIPQNKYLPLQVVFLLCTNSPLHPSSLSLFHFPELTSFLGKISRPRMSNVPCAQGWIQIAGHLLDWTQLRVQGSSGSSSCELGYAMEAPLQRQIQAHSVGWQPKR